MNLLTLIREHYDFSDTLWLCGSVLCCDRWGGAVSLQLHPTTLRVLVAYLKRSAAAPRSDEEAER